MLTIKNLVKRYKENIAVDNLSLHIPEGKVIGLLGPNGAGKTTTINAIMGLIGIDQGEITIFGKSLKKDAISIKSDIGFVPQFISIYYDLTVEENLKFFGKLYGLRGKELMKRVDEVISIIGLDEQRHAKPKTFSGGMKRRLNIGCALVHFPKLLIMDEPTVGIDAQSRNYILDTIKELNKRGMTIIYTSHYMNEVEYLCDQVIIIDRGRVIAEGNLDTLSQLVSQENMLHVSFREGAVLDLEQLKSMSGIKAVELADERYKIVYEKEVMSKNMILGHFIHEGVEIDEIKDLRPSLEDVFLTITGKSLRD